MKTSQYILISSVGIIVSILYLNLSNLGILEEGKEKTITAKTIIVTNGFGYEILENNTVIIKQQYIPVISGKHIFCSEKDARTVAELVVNKIEKRESPRISYEELVESKVSLNCP